MASVPEGSAGSVCVLFSCVMTDAASLELHACLNIQFLYLLFREAGLLSHKLQTVQAVSPAQVSDGPEIWNGSAPRGEERTQVLNANTRACLMRDNPIWRKWGNRNC